MIKKLYIYLSGAQITKINILVIYTIIMEICILYMIMLRNLDEIILRLLNLISIGILLLNIYIIHSIFIICQQNEELMRMNLIELQNQENERRIKEFKNSEERIKKLQHDYKNHCLNMGNLLRKGEYFQLENYLNKLTENTVGGELEYIKTKSPIIDAVLNTKIFQSKQAQIDISCYVFGNIKEREMEIGSILFNLLDNAIEASKKNKGEKRIICRIIQTSIDIDINIKNYIENSILENNKNLYTEKEDKEKHGIGLKIVEEVVENMNGAFEVYEEDEMFCTHIYLPLG